MAGKAVKTVGESLLMIRNLRSLIGLPAMTTL